MAGSPNKPLLGIVTDGKSPRAKDWLRLERNGENGEIIQMESTGLGGWMWGVSNTEGDARISSLNTWVDGGAIASEQSDGSDHEFCLGCVSPRCLGYPRRNPGVRQTGTQVLSWE